MRRRTGVLGSVTVVALVALAVWWWARAGSGTAESDAPASGSAAAHATARDARDLAKTATLSGRVTSAKDGAPIVGASVAIELAGDHRVEVPLVVVATDQQGHWTTALAAGDYRVAAMAEGFLPATQAHVEVGAHAVVELDLALRTGGVMVLGTVTDIGGGPIDGVQIATLGDDTRIATTTRADGTYRLSLAEGAHALEATDDDYLRARANIHLQDRPVRCDFRLVPGGSLHGIVVARDGERPIAGALVTVGWGAESYVATTETGTDGTFLLRQVPGGEFSAYAQAAGFASATATQVVLGIGQTVETRIVVDRGYTIRGRVVRAGQPSVGVAGVKLDAHTDAPVNDARSTSLTGSDGAFEIVGLAPALYHLKATGDTILDHEEPPLRVDHDLDGVIIPVSSGVTLRGRVDPPAKVRISFARTRWEDDLVPAWTAHVEVAEDGTFVARNVTPGAITLYAEGDEISGKLELQLDGTDRNDLVVPLRPRHADVIAGRVVDETGRPVADAFVATDGAETKSANDGSFRLEVVASLRLYAATTLALVDWKHPTMTLEHPASDVVLRIELPHEQITGKVISGDGAAAADVWVSTPRSERVLTGGDGEFVLRPLPAGTYDVIAQSATGDRHVTAKGVQTGDRITLTLQTTPTLHGRVTLGGRPVPRYDLRCYLSQYIERRIASEDGTFTFPHVQKQPNYPSTCSAATADGQGDAAVVFTSDAASVEIELKPYTTVTGTVIDVFTKKPLAGVVVVPLTLDMGLQLEAGVNQFPVDANGRFRIAHLPGTETFLRVVRHGFATDVLGHATVRPDPGHTIETIIPALPPAGDRPGGIGLGIDPQYVVQSVEPNGGAANQGIRVGDRIVAINGVALAPDDRSMWLTLLWSRGAIAGQTYALELARGVTVPVTAR